jgi:hypothetical protein
MAALKRKVRVECGKIPEVMFQKSIKNMKKRAVLMAGVKASILRAGGKLLRNKAIKYVLMQKRPPFICNSRACNCYYEI